MTDKGHREAIFSDTILREMGLELPMSVEEMLAIPNIRPEMVDLYGKRFLKLIKNTKNLYGNKAPERKDLPPYRHTRDEGAEEDQDEDEVLDPNHLNVIDLCDSDSDADPGLPVEESESDYSYADVDKEEEEEEEMQTSHHFAPNQDPDVVAFNARASQLGTAVPKARAAPTRGGSKAAGNKRGPNKKRNGSGSFGGKSYSGVKKGRAIKAAGSRASGGAAAAKKAAAGGRKGGGESGAGGQLAVPWSSIMAMPTN